jgi:MFS family permease
MKSERWLRIIPVALIMYIISYVDRTNISLALDPRISNMMKDLGMTDEMKGHAAGIFFIGYVMMQIPGGWLATHWSPRKLISLCLMCWGVCAVACGLSRTFLQFEIARFLLGVSESGVFPAMVVLLANWFPSAERARSNAYWNMCQPIAIVTAALSMGWLLGLRGWRWAILLEGLLPFIWLPVWWLMIRDHPREAAWISAGEREYLETTLGRERAGIEGSRAVPLMRRFMNPAILIMVVIYFLHCCQAYGCMTFFTETLKGRGYDSLEYGVFFAIPQVIAIVAMVLVSQHSDKVHERRWHLAVVYIFCGASLVLSMMCRQYFWLSYALLCCAIPGPSVALAPLWSVVTETLPRHTAGAVIGFINAVGNLGGYYGPSIVGWLKQQNGGRIELPFMVLGAGMILAGLLSPLLPKSVPVPAAAAAT